MGVASAVVFELASGRNQAGPVSPPALVSMFAGGTGASGLVVVARFSIAGEDSIVGVAAGVITGSGGGVDAGGSEGMGVDAGTSLRVGFGVDSVGKVGAIGSVLIGGVELGTSVVTAVGVWVSAATDSITGAAGTGGKGSDSITLGLALLTPTGGSEGIVGVLADKGISGTLVGVVTDGVGFGSVGLAGEDVRLGSVELAIGLLFCSSGI